MSSAISHLSLRNWRNFQEVDVDLRARAFLIGPNASGKSNFLDALALLNRGCLQTARRSPTTWESPST